MIDLLDLDLKIDEHGNFMARFEISRGSYAYLHLLPVETVDGVQESRDKGGYNPYWDDFCRLTDGMDGPLQTIKHKDQEFLYFIVPAMT